MKYLSLIALLFAFNLRAQTDTNAVINNSEVSIADESVESPNINIEGKYKVEEPVIIKEEKIVIDEKPADKVKKEEKKIVIIEKTEKNIKNEKRIYPELKKAEPKLSAAEQLKDERKKLEEENRLMLEQQLEQIRLQQELELTKKLEQSMNDTLKAIDSLNPKK